MPTSPKTNKKYSPLAILGKWLAWPLGYAMGILLLFSACSGEPEFPLTPEISLRTVKLEKNLGPNTSQDTILIEIDYRDGDGDLGMTEEQQTGMFAKYLPGQNDINPLYNNLRVRVFIENNGRFDSIPPFYNDQTGLMLSRPSDATMKPFTQRREPIEGTIRYFISEILYAERFGPFPPPGRPLLKSGTRYYVTAQISDRAGNVSNRVQSDIFVAP